MQIYYEGDQACLFDPATLSGKMSQAPSRAAAQRAKTSGSSSKKSSELAAVPYMFLDLTPGHGDLWGRPYWQMISPLRGDALTLNTGVSPRGVRESSLSQILEEHPHQKYYLTRTACTGIIRRASERGKILPKGLQDALEIQSGLKELTTAPAEGQSYHINQRNEGIDLGGISGALMATQNMQMQTFVTQAEPTGFDGYNGDLTGDVSATLGTNCGMSTGRNGVIQPRAVGIDSKHACQTGDVANTLATNCGSSSGRNGVMVTAPVLCLNDQGGQIMSCSENVVGTLRAEEHGHQPLVLSSNQDHASIQDDGISPTLPASMGMGGGYVPMLYENHGIDSRYKGPLQVAPTMSARYGTGGNNVPLVGQPEETICVTEGPIGREMENVPAIGKHAIYSRQRVDAFHENDVVSTESARQHKDATDLVCQPYQKVTDHEEAHDVEARNLIRRLTPLECERLQGFPDGWTNIPNASDSARYKALGNSVAIPCVDFLTISIVLYLDHVKKQGGEQNHKSSL